MISRPRWTIVPAPRSTRYHLRPSGAGDPSVAARAEHERGVAVGEARQVAHVLRQRHRPPGAPEGAGVEQQQVPVVGGGGEVRAAHVGKGDAAAVADPAAQQLHACVRVDDLYPSPAVAGGVPVAAGAPRTCAQPLRLDDGELERAAPGQVEDREPARRQLVVGRALDRQPGAVGAEPRHRVGVRRDLVEADPADELRGAGQVPGLQLVAQRLGQVEPVSVG
jgi:hypothetical protein